MNPLISVIIPAYNNADTLSRAVDSIRNQTYRNLEIIIVDDFSTDETHAIAKSYATQDKRIQILQGTDDPNRFDTRLNRNINAGWSARNTGLLASQGEYITFQDGDDVSLLNRIEIQYTLLKKNTATHITTSNGKFDTSLIGTKYEKTLPQKPNMGPEEIYNLAKHSKGIFPGLFPTLNTKIPFHFKRKRIINKLFFNTLAPYPGASNSPLFHRSVTEKIQFRPLTERIWPSFMGRGADRDFNFQVAETFKNSYYFDLPLYLWSRLS